MANTSTRRQVVRLAVGALCLAMAGVATSSRPWAAEDERREKVAEIRC